MFTVERPGAQATRFLDSYYSNLGNNENNRILGYNRYYFQTADMYRYLCILRWATNGINHSERMYVHCTYRKPATQQKPRCPTKVI